VEDTRGTGCCIVRFRAYLRWAIAKIGVPVRPSLKLVVPAAAVALIAAAPSLAATATHGAHIARPSAALRGSV
jgi:hypothetical protein